MAYHRAVRIEPCSTTLQTSHVQRLEVLIKGNCCSVALERAGPPRFQSGKEDKSGELLVLGALDVGLAPGHGNSVSPAVSFCPSIHGIRFLFLR